jgi:4-diphosphocytidyl-2-C-methyl-D-erythritol kinase
MLRVLSKREDSYHLLQTYFQLLNWGDDMQFQKIQHDSIVIEGQFNNLNSQDNLIYKAAQFLLPYRTTKTGIKICVNKRIPQGSGLGGGSSNAGTTLITLNKIWQCHLPTDKLLDFAIKLGADVPVFVLNSSAMAMGIGEKLTPYKVQEYYYVLIFPDCSINTAEVFANKELQRDQDPILLKDINKPENWNNTCLKVVLKNYPKVKQVYDTASKTAPILMSGTGSTLFSYFNSKAQALDFIQQCPTDWNTVLCQSKINTKKS